MSWLPTPPSHINQSSLINGNYSLSAVQSPDFNRTKRNPSSLNIDDSYPLFQVYQGDNLQKQSCITPPNYQINAIQQHSVKEILFFCFFYYLIN